MNQDIKATQDSLGSLVVDPALSATSFKSDHLCKALSPEVQLVPVRIDSYDGLSKWMGSEHSALIEIDETVARRELDQKNAARVNIEAAVREAHDSVKSFAINRELKLAKQNLQALKAQEHSSHDARNTAIHEAVAKVAELESALRKEGTPKYARTVKALRNYAFAVQEFASLESDAQVGDDCARHAVLELETQLMPKVDNVYMGVPGKVDPLPRITLKQPFDPHCRLEALRLHLDARSNAMDLDQEARVSSVANNPIFRDVLGRAHELPRDGAVFFLRDGQIVKSGDNGMLMIDVPRMRLGVGKEGAGLFRFIGQEEEIDGAAVIKLKLKNGKPIPLKGSNPSSPKFAKEVCELIGNCPDWLKHGMTFGEVVKRFGQCRNQPVQPGTASGAEEQVSNSS